ncbi:MULTISPECIES: RloB family protein [unclassified Actinobaculum]|uniref:RloB family protein n=1 Tax=unclassified Actinobaculum TaxID=2609299 RepID=UPI000D529733|nr:MULTISPECIES: RloB family protein [unclassified Actinobaculum]AWE41838.1 RloB domain-containing protein [Actinobaculum sp. 313]RTE50244.1 RloB domain-containing protein [Actinobaculum sp. 352]
MSKDITRRNGRRANRREVRKTVLLVTNGEKTERLYLEELKRRTAPNDVAVTLGRPIPGDPMTLMRKLEYQHATSAFDEVWIVVDHDGEDRSEFLAECLRRSRPAKRRGKGTMFYGVVSLPCFEVWLIAHYEQVGNFQDQNEAQQRYRQLTGLTSKEQKSLPGSFPWEEIGSACERSRLKGVAEPEVNTQGPHPSTTMPHLVRSLGLV